METIIVNGIIGFIIVFLALETINWFVFTTKLMKYNFQKSALTEAQARAILKHVRFIYFWLSSSYYFNKLREAYYLVHSSGNVSSQTKEELRKSLNRRFVRGLPKVSVTNWIFKSPHCIMWGLLFFFGNKKAIYL